MLDAIGSDHILSASMVTIHSATGSQKVLDAVPKAGATDIRKNRSIMNNIILTTTGAAKALKLVLPEMGDIGFMAESVRVPTATGSLIILTLNIQAEDPSKPINRQEINDIYQTAAEGPLHGYLSYSEHQNVSSDIIGFPSAAATIESTETHSRTAMVRMYRRLEAILWRHRSPRLWYTAGTTMSWEATPICWVIAWLALPRKML